MEDMERPFLISLLDTTFPSQRNPMHQAKRLLLGSFALFLAVSSPAQIIFESSIDLPGEVALYNLEVLPDGDLFMSGRHGDSLLLVRSTPLGEVVWQRVHPEIGRQYVGPEADGRSLWPTTDGMYSLTSLALNSGLYVFDPANGDVVFSNTDLIPSSLAWTSADSLVWLRGNPTATHLVFGDKYGGIAWEVESPVFSNPSSSIEFDLTTRTSTGEIMVLGVFSYPDPFSMTLTYKKVWLGHYSSLGTLVDSLSFDLVSADAAWAIQLDQTSDGGFLGLVRVGSGYPMWIKGNADGDITSTIDWGDVYASQSEMSGLTATRTMELPGGGYRTICEPFNGWPIDLIKSRAIFDMDSTGAMTCIRYLVSDSTLRDPIGDLGIDAEGWTFACGGASYQPYGTPILTWTGIDELCDITTQVTTTESALTLQISPQPSTGRFTISGLPDGASYSISVYNSSGKLVQQSQEQSTPFTINLTDNPEGLYPCVITNGKGMRWQVKLMRIE